MLEAIVAQPIRAITYAAPYRRGENDEPSRDLCLAALVESLGSTAVASRVTETVSVKPVAKPATRRHA